MLNIKNILAAKGITNKAFAEFLGCAERTAYNKLMGVTDFTWPEVKKIQDCLLPEYNPRYLLSEVRNE